MTDKEQICVDTERRELALRYACTQFSKTRLTLDQNKITDLAVRFLHFMETGT